MVKKLFIFLTTAIAILLLASCTQKKDFNYGLKKIQDLTVNYNSKINSPPLDIKSIDGLSTELKNIKKLQLESGQEPFNLVIDYMLHDLEATRLYTEADDKYGRYGTTKYGFGCKGRANIVNSTYLRNESAGKGFKAVETMVELIEKYPEEAALANLSQKNKLFLNATYYVIFKEAKSDRNIINHFCPQNVTDELLRQEELKKSLVGG